MSGYGLPTAVRSYAIGYSTSNTTPGGNTTTGSSNGSGSASHTITASTAGSGSVKSSFSSAVSGTKITVTVTPDDGYTLKTLAIKDVNGNMISYTANSDNTYTFTMPSTAVTVTAVFYKAPERPDVTGVSSVLQTVDHIKYLSGYRNGMVGSERNMTRGEVAQMFYNLLLNQNVTATVSFTDVSDTLWCAKAVDPCALPVWPCGN